MKKLLLLDLVFDNVWKEVFKRDETPVLFDKSFFLIINTNIIQNMFIYFKKK